MSPCSHVALISCFKVSNRDEKKCILSALSYCLEYGMVRFQKFVSFLGVRDWMIAVIVVAVFVFLLLVFIVGILIRMYRRKQSLGKTRYDFSEGQTNQGAVLE